MFNRVFNSNHQDLATIFKPTVTDFPRKMSVTRAFSALSLGRVATRSNPSPLRPFSTSQSLLASKHNKHTLGKQTAPKPTLTAKTDLSAEDEKPPVNTEAPLTSREPAPDNAPASSAEVPPNNAMPPPPPKETKSSMEELLASLMVPDDAGASSATGPYRYDASKPGSNRPIDLEKMVGDKFNMFRDGNYDPKLHDPTLLPNARTAPVTGRTIFIDSTSSRPGKVNNPEAAFKRLDIVMSQNRIKMMWHQQRFQERAGMKRKRLKMFRWKKRFRVGFVETARRVKELKKQGW